MEVSHPQENVTHAVIGGGTAIEFGISSSAEFFQILSSTLYTDQKLAVVREVLCNAWDAHVESRRTHMPIQITLDEHHMTVRDFGNGIPHDMIGPIYAVYGDSTKKNDGKQTGGFGLGCKAPFAYTDHFEVISYSNGIRSIYNMSKSNAQAMGKPSVITLAQSPTTEQGLSVKIPLKWGDRSSFKELIQRIVRNGEMKAHLNNELLPTLPFSSAKDGYLITSSDLMGRNSTGQLLVRYGNVLYPIPSMDGIDDSGFTELRTKTLSFVHSLQRAYYRGGGLMNLVLQAPPNSIAVTPSREALSMQEHTIRTLCFIMDRFLKKMEGMRSRSFELSKTLTEEGIRTIGYKALFSDGWAFNTSDQIQEGTNNLVTLDQVAQYSLCLGYPEQTSFRYLDIQHRVETAVGIKLLEPTLAKSFIKKAEGIHTTIPTWGRRITNKDNTSWLQRHVLGKLMGKLYANGMDPNGLYVMDSNDPSADRYELNMVPATVSSGRHHMINFPFLRKLILVTTSKRTVRSRLEAYEESYEGADKVKNIPYATALVYVTSGRKQEKLQEVLELFRKLKYEVVDLTKVHGRVAAPKPPKVKVEYIHELPALSNCLDSYGAVKTHYYRLADAVKLSKPELVLVVNNKTHEANFQELSNAGSRALIKLFGDRCGVAQDKREQARMIKMGSRDALPAMSEEVKLILLTSPNFKEYIQYSRYRLKDIRHSCYEEDRILDMIYETPELRDEFGLINNLSKTEKLAYQLYRTRNWMQETDLTEIDAFVEANPMAPANKDLIEKVIGNVLINVFDAHYLKEALKGSSRSTYINILINAIKG